MKRAMALGAMLLLTALGTSPLVAQAGQGPLVPQPFPGSTPARPADQPSAPATSITSRAPEPARPSVQPPDGLPVYPSAEFIDGFDAGSGQRYYLYGANAPYVTVVTYYKNALKNGGRELLKTPPMQQFDLGRFEETAMAYPPSVVVKDYTWNGGSGYLAISGTTEKRYRTVIQIVPAGPGR